MIKQLHSSTKGSLRSGPPSAGSMRPNDDSLFEDRFREFNRNLWEKIVSEHDQQKNRFRFDRTHLQSNLQFVESIPLKVVQILKQLIPAILEFAERQGIVLKEQNHQIHFVDVPNYEKQTGKSFPPTIPLPASVMKYHAVNRIYTITIILPSKIQTNEEVVNITRTLFAKFIGEVYFEEQVLDLAFYREAMRQEQGTLSVAMPDQWNFILAQDFPYTPLEKYLQNFAVQNKMRYPQQLSQIKIQVQKDWNAWWEQKKMPTAVIELIQNAFQEYLLLFKTNPEEKLNQMIAKVEQLNGQMVFILPHELKAYQLFEEQQKRHYIQAAEAKIEEIFTYLGFIAEVFASLTAGSIESPYALIEQIHFQIAELKRKGKVRVFLIPAFTLGPELLAEKQRFPLRLVKLLPRTLPVAQWSKEVKNYQKKYENSIYQKIFEALVYLKHWLKATDEGRGKEYPQQAEYGRLKVLLQNFNFREPMLKQLYTNLGTMKECVEITLPKKKNEQFPLQTFRKAWSYFISSVLIHLYYIHLNQNVSGPRKINPDRYLQTIEQYVVAQMKREPNLFHVVHLLLKVYLSKGTQGLTFLVYVLHNPVPALKYVLMQIVKAPEPNQSWAEEWPKRLQKTDEFTKMLIEVYDKKIQEDLLKGRDY